MDICIIKGGETEMRKWKTELRGKIHLYLKMGWDIKESMLDEFVKEWGQRGVKASEIYPYIDELKVMFDL